MKLLDKLLGKAFSTSHDHRAPPQSASQQAANYLIGWAWDHTKEGPATDLARQTAIQYLAIKGFQPSRDLHADVVAGYSPEKRQICYALDGVKEHGALIGRTAITIEHLGDTGRVSDPDMATVEHGLDLRYVKT